MPLHESCPPVAVVSAHDVIDARVEGTHQERARHRLTPYRLHQLTAPVPRRSLDVRRGKRRYPLDLD
ncbi:hypothetical protein ACH4TV_41140 [Streptomyces sp. NPDC020898]|uniref:hypothetical protein n=1 Tax=Streptomyces sp. NPDC020898 TaxID=3365101 RepID=UPI00378DF88F